MRTESYSKTNTPSGIKCLAPWRLTKVTPLQNYILEVEFTDGTHGFVEMHNFVMSEKAGVFSVLKNKDLFNQVYLTYGVATWPGQLDLAPDTMHDEIQAKGRWILS